MEKLFQNESMVESAFKDVVRRPRGCRKRREFTPFKDAVRRPRTCRKRREFTPFNAFQDFVLKSPGAKTEKHKKKNEKSPHKGYKRYAPANRKQIVESITGADYMNAILNEGGSATNETKQPANGSSSNFDEERASDVESLDSRIEEEGAELETNSTMEELFQDESMIESPFKDMVRRPRSCRKRPELTPSNVFHDSVIESPEAETEKQNKKTEKSPHQRFIRYAPANPKQIVESISGMDYMNAIFNQVGSATNKPKQPANGSPWNFDVERASDVESHDSWTEGKDAALEICEQEEESDVLDIEAHIASLEYRFAKIDEVLAELRNGKDM